MSFKKPWDASSRLSDDSSTRTSSPEPEGIPPTSRILLDEKLPGPLYGLPAIDTNYRHSHTRATGYLRSKATLRRERVQFELELLSQKALWNADLPIHSLPAEILLQIFEQLTRPILPGTLPAELYMPEERPRRSWAGLMRVCRHWCALIRNAAFLWKDVVISQNTRWFDLALRRLGSTPIRIHLAPDCDLEVVLPKLNSHTDHIGGLIFGQAIGDGDVPCLESFLSRSFPALQSLTIAMNSPAHDIRAIGNSCSGLQSLDLMYTSVPWKKSVLAHLKVLSLTDCRSSSSALPFLNFLDVLEHGQHLQYLSLTRFLSAVLVPLTSAPPERLVTLPSLRYLECGDVLADVSSLMTHIHTPAISHVKLLGDCNWTTPSTARASLLPEDPGTRFPILQSIAYASLMVDSFESTLHLSRPTTFERSLHNLGVAVGESRPWFKMELSLLPALLGPALTELDLCGALDILQDVWDHVFDSIPALQKLILNENKTYDLPVVILRSLAAAAASPRSVPHGADYTDAGTRRAPRVRCPALKHLSIDGWEWSRRGYRQILECLRVRAAHGAPRLEYFGANADECDTIPFLLWEKYRVQFLVVVDKLELGGWSC